MKIARSALLVLMILALLAPGAGGEDEKDPDTLALDGKFFAEFAKMAPILRDNFLEDKINAIIQGRGLVRSIRKVERFKKNYRVVLVDQDAESMGLRFVYHVYIDSRHSIALLKEQERLEFSGQLAAWTPLNSRRDAYILDIIFEKGAVLVE